MNLLHLSFVGGLKHNQDPPMPLTAEERLREFRAAYPAACANAYPWQWLGERNSLPRLEAGLVSRAMLDRIADDTRVRMPRPA